MIHIHHSLVGQLEQFQFGNRLHIEENGLILRSTPKPATEFITLHMMIDFNNILSPANHYVEYHFLNLPITIITRIHQFIGNDHVILTDCLPIQVPSYFRMNINLNRDFQRIDNKNNSLREGDVFNIGSVVDLKVLGTGSLKELIVKPFVLEQIKARYGQNQQLREKIQTHLSFQCLVHLLSLQFSQTKIAGLRTDELDLFMRIQKSLIMPNMLSNEQLTLYDEQISEILMRETIILEVGQQHLVFGRPYFILIKSDSREYPFTIGSDQICDIIVKDACISRVHAHLTFETHQRSGWVIFDGEPFSELPSTNGTYKQIHKNQEYLMTPSDEIRIGLHHYSYSIPPITSQLQAQQTQFLNSKYILQQLV